MTIRPAVTLRLRRGPLWGEITALVVLAVSITIGVASGPQPILPGALSTLALSLLVYGPSGVAAIIAVFVGVIWVGGVAVELILRDGATRNASATALARNAERLARGHHLRPRRARARGAAIGRLRFPAQGCGPATTGGSRARARNRTEFAVWAGESGLVR